VSQRVDKDSLPLDKPRRTPGHPTKSHIVKTNVGGKEKIIRFGEQGAETAGKPKVGESDRMKQKRASFKSRHAKNIAKGKSSPAYWANKVKWAEGGAVKMAAGGSPALALIEQMRRSGAQTPEFDAVLASTREQRSRPRPRPQAAPQAATPRPTPVAAQPREEELPLPPLPPARRPDENPPPGAPRNPMVFDEGNPHVATAIRMARQYGIPREIFLSLVQQESGFNPGAVSPRGAIGLGQLMPATARELNVDPRNPEQNLEGSARYLRQMLDRFGSMELALAAYNAGPTTVRRAGNTIPNIRETQQYVPSILRRAGASTGPEYARGGLAELDQKYAEGGAVQAYDPDAIEQIAQSVTEPEGYAEGGEVMSDEEYDRRLLSRMKTQTGRTTEPTRAEQMQALRTAGTSAAEGLADVLLPQSPLDVALMVALGPGGRAARLAGAGALAALEPSEAEASRLRRLIRAYHGSPHKFEEFDIRKIGTGEGAQAYGHGLYFADSEDVAKFYRDNLAPFRPGDVQDVRTAISDREVVLARALDDQVQISSQVQSGRLLPNALRNADNDVAQARYDLDIQQRRFAEMNDNLGHIYEVDLHATPRELLDLDRRIADNSPDVQEAINRVYNENPKLLRSERGVGANPEHTGSQVYQTLSNLYGSPVEVSNRLVRAGVPGSQYLDAGSRAVGGNHNYVVFDPEIIDIRRRYAQGGLAELEQKYAEGGAVNAEPAPYNADAVDALVKQIEAEYV
jgi:soluble lytic murein transglycosylase-like protein